MKRTVQTDKAPRAIGAYSQAIVAGSFVFTSGQIARDPANNELIEGGVREQTARVLHNLAAVLQAAGSSLKDVVKTTVFLSDMNDFAVVNEVYANFFADAAPPARSTVEVARLPLDVKVEIEAVALITTKSVEA
ncbi:MAG: RidA family protein [Pyrinomonadaceae bacterium MAG19_C2-C3]|nr:RidA family protein [Pyrinomonadaceae bacterium MAG19_C2-C3]